MAAAHTSRQRLLFAAPSLTQFFGRTVAGIRMENGTARVPICACSFEVLWRINRKLRSGRLSEGKHKNCTLVSVISDRDSTAVRLHDLLHDGETQSDTSSFDTPASPKPFEYPLLLLDWNSGTTVGNVDATVRAHLNCHVLAQRRVGYGILD